MSVYLDSFRWNWLLNQCTQNLIALLVVQMAEQKVSRYGLLQTFKLVL